MATTIGLIQVGMGSDPEANTARALDLVRKAARAGAQIICLPELFRSQYFCQTEDPDRFRLAEPVPGPTTEAFEAVARETDTVLILSLFEQRTAGLYHNTAAVIDGAAGYIGKYRKMHVPDDPRYYEKYYFAPGDLGFRVFDTRFGRIGVLICWDQWFPEAARLTAMRGADVLFYPTAIGWHPEERAEFGDAQHGAWETMQRAHAIANGCHVVSVNRTGFEAEPGDRVGTGGVNAAGIQFWGQSFVAGPDGVILDRLGTDFDGFGIVELDRSRTAEIRHGWPFLRDRRIDAYDGLSRRFLDD